MLEKFDTNHNGTIDPEEREAMKAQREARRAEMLKKYDTDGDGKLSDTEREALPQGDPREAPAARIAKPASFVPSSPPTASGGRGRFLFSGGFDAPRPPTRPAFRGYAALQGPDWSGGPNH